MDVVVAAGLVVLAWWAPPRRAGRWRWPMRIGLVLLGLVALWKLASARAGLVGPTLLRVDVDRPVVALTFDDGPTPAYTKPVLDLLEAEGVRATFFVTGQELAGHPELGRAILEGGHELGNHSWSHGRMIFRSAAWLTEEVESTDRVLRDVGVTGPIPFRPPYGKRLWGLHAVLGERPAVLWDVEPESFADIASDPEALAAHVVERAQPGSIVLLHAMYASRQATRDALPAIVRGLRRKGLEPVPLGELTR